MKIVGLTGNSGSGKSTLANYLHDKYNVGVIDADKIGHEMLKKGSPAYDELIQIFGHEILDNKDDIDRKALGAIVFSDPEELAKLNQISHYHITVAIKQIIKEKASKGCPLLIIDAAILLQSQVKELVDTVWVVISEEQLRIKRLLARDSVSKEAILKRIGAQWSNQRYIDQADVVIENTGDIAAFYEACDQLYKEISLNGGTQ